MRDEALDEDGEEDLDNPDHDGGIRTAVRTWYEDPAAAKARYGPARSSERGAGLFFDVTLLTKTKES